MVLVPRRGMHSSFAARQAAQRHYYYRPQQQVYLPPRRIFRAGPAFALLVPTTYTIETQQPEPEHHLQASGHNFVGTGTELVLVLVVFLVVAGQVMMRIIRIHDGAVLSGSREDAP